MNLKFNLFCSYLDMEFHQSHLELQTFPNIHSKQIRVEGYPSIELLKIGSYHIYKDTLRWRSNIKELMLLFYPTWKGDTRDFKKDLTLSKFCSPTDQLPSMIKKMSLTARLHTRWQKESIIAKDASYSWLTSTSGSLSTPPSVRLTHNARSSKKSTFTITMKCAIAAHFIAISTIRDHIDTQT